MLTIEHAEKTFGDTIVLNKVSLQIKSGTITGLAGPSGSGKSTLLRCIQGLETLSEGSISFDGHSGFMFQDFQLFPHMTVLENLIFAPSFHETHEIVMARAQQLIATLNLADKANDYPASLSGGQKQRVAFARSLMMRPDILLCDEPTSGLDFKSITDIIEIFKSIKKAGQTIIIASHDLEFLTKVSDRILFLKDGNMTFDKDNINNTMTHQFISEHY